MGSKVYVDWLFTKAGKLGQPVPFEGATKEEIQATIARLTSENQVMIFSKSLSPHCHRAKKIFDDLKQKYSVVEVNKLPEMSLIQDTLNEATGARTVPRVFVNGICIGGGAETADLLAKGELQKLLETKTSP